MSENFTEPKYPKKLLWFTISAFAILLSINLFIQFNTIQLFRKTNQEIRELDYMKERINLHFQRKEQAVHVGAFSGYVSWENKYFRHKKGFYEKLRKVHSILPNIPDIESDSQDRELNALDQKIFESIRLGDLKKAKTELQSINRERLLNREAFLLDEVKRIISLHTDGQSKIIDDHSKIITWLNLAMVLVLSALTAGMISIFSGWARKIKEVNSSLDSLVQKKSEELNEERMKVALASKMVALGEMAGGIAHEINTPLAIIMAVFEQIGEMTEDGVRDKTHIKAPPHSLVKTVQRISNIVKGLRTFSRDGTGDPFRPASIRSLINETLSFCNSRLSANGISIKADEIDESLLVDCRETQISQVLLNLLGNASDAIEKLEDKWIQIGAQANGDWVELTVTDSGGGISEATREKIFQPFFTTKEVGKGTGMGLSISIGIIKAHKGEITVDTTCPNTRFIVRLPKRQVIAEPRLKTA